MMYQIIVLFDGYSKQLEDEKTEANCSCTLIKSPTINIIVDTMTAWDRDKIVTGEFLNGLDIFHFLWLIII